MAVSMGAGGGGSCVGVSAAVMGWVVGIRAVGGVGGSVEVEVPVGVTGKKAVGLEARSSSVTILGN